MVFPGTSAVRIDHHKVIQFLDTTSYLAHFEKHIAKFEVDGNCVICMDKMDTEGAIVRKLFNCGHVFHNKCLYTWIK